MELLLVIAATLCAAGAGAVAERQLGARAERGSDRTLNAVLYTVLPVVVFFNVVGLELDANVAGGLALAWLALLASGGLAYLATRHRPRPATGAVVVSVLGANTGFLGYPLVAIFLGTERLPQAVAYDLLVTVPMLVVICFAVGAAFGTEAGAGARERTRTFMVRNPLLPAFALALVAPDALAPDVLVTLSQALVFALLPVGFFAVGVHLAATSGGRFSLPRPGADIGVMVIGRLALAPLLLYLLALPLIEVPASFLLLAAMPTGLNTLLVASAFGLDRRLAAGAIAWTTLVALAVAAVAAAAGAA